MTVLDLRNCPPAGTDISTHPLSGVLASRRPVVGGILNVTPDSFSDRGRLDCLDAGIQQEHLVVHPGVGFGKTPAQIGRASCRERV